MTIKVKNNKKPMLPVCEMVCDVEINKKLNKYELTKLCYNSHQTSLICGPPGSGKTNFMYSLLKSKHLLNKCYDKIFLFQPSESRASMKDKLFDSIDDSQKYEELSFDNLNEVKENLDEEGNNCIVFDDMGSYLKDNEIKKLLKSMIMNRRHLHLSIFFLTQTWYSIDKDMRRLFSSVFIFRIDKNSMFNIFDEIVEGKKEQIPEIVKLVYDKPYQFLMIHVSSQRFMKGFDELIF